MNALIQLTKMKESQMEAPAFQVQPQAQLRPPQLVPSLNPAKIQLQPQLTQPSIMSQLHNRQDLTPEQVVANQVAQYYQLCMQQSQQLTGTGGAPSLSHPNPSDIEKGRQRILSQALGLSFPTAGPSQLQKTGSKLSVSTSMESHLKEKARKPKSN